ncbi:hypothetical protein EJ02DRAFT_424349 [Clathrospora elynae]|uniref:Uncharacterized protein n=1 Tax=Clathrospora elynae TaxID=706981 RepID=A0A6A5SJV4_9PLEO|nr:hypothetical protein EJ02DRAFT_424349 [Clathrospora elynae]
MAYFGMQEVIKDRHRLFRDEDRPDFDYESTDYWTEEDFTRGYTSDEEEVGDDDDDNDTDDVDDEEGDAMKE